MAARGSRALGHPANCDYGACMGGVDENCDWDHGRLSSLADAKRTRALSWLWDHRWWSDLHPPILAQFLRESLFAGVLRAEIARPL